MSVSVLSPRINGELLNQYIGRIVRIAVKVIKTNPSQANAEVETSDEKIIHIRINPENYVAYQTQFVEILGTVNSDLSITETTVFPFSQTFDLKNYDQLVRLTTVYKDLF